MSTLKTAVLTIAGSDSCGGAGIQADLKTFAAFGVHGASALTALTAQNTLGVHAVHPVPPEFIAAQLDAVFADLPVRAAKTGMLPDAPTVEAVMAALDRHAPDLPLVVDPVMVATSGASLVDNPAREALRELAARAALLTPNTDEAEALSGKRVRGPDDLLPVAEALLALGCRAVLLKGGHLEGDEVRDLLLDADGPTWFRHPRRTGRHHGTGCVLSAAVAAGLALGRPLKDAVADAVAHVQRVVATARTPRAGKLQLLGTGISPSAK